MGGDGWVVRFPPNENPLTAKCLFGKSTNCRMTQTFGWMLCSGAPSWQAVGGAAAAALRGACAQRQQQRRCLGPLGLPADVRQQQREREGRRAGEGGRPAAPPGAGAGQDEPRGPLRDGRLRRDGRRRPGRLPEGNRECDRLLGQTVTGNEGTVSNLTLKLTAAWMFISEKLEACLDLVNKHWQRCQFLHLRQSLAGLTMTFFSYSKLTSNTRWFRLITTFNRL